MPVAESPAQVLLPKKRGRPSKKPSSALETINDEPEHPIAEFDTKTKIKITEEDKPIKSPSPKRRMMSGNGSGTKGGTGSGTKSNDDEEDKPIKSPSPKRRIMSSSTLQASTSSIASATLTSSPVKDVSSITDTTTTSVSGAAEMITTGGTTSLAGIKKRGRPPKKAYIAEMEEEAENARKKIQNEIDNNAAAIKMPLEEDVIKKPSLDGILAKPLDNVVIEPAATSNITPIIAAQVKNNQNIDDSFIKESEKIPPRKRGRPKKTLIDVESNAADDKIIEEEEEVDYHHQIPAKKRAISRENALVLNEPPPARAAPSKEIFIPTPQTTPKDKSEVVPKPMEHKNVEHEEKTTSSNEKSQEKVVEKVKSELPCTNEVNDNQYTIQKSTNPLKFKLKTGKELQNDDTGIPSGGVPKVPLKLKLSLKSSDSAGTDQEVLMKKKKKKKKHKAEKTTSDAADEKPHVILKIKSPTRGFGGSNNGFVIKNEQQQQKNDTRKNIVKSPPLQDISGGQRATSSGSGDIQATAISFSPESSPEHVPTSQHRNFPFMAGTTKSKSTDEIGLGEGQFNDLMKGLDSDEESREQLKNNPPPPQPQKSASASSSVKQSQVDGTIDSWSRSSSISQDSPIHLDDIGDNDFVNIDNNIPEIDDRNKQGVIHKRMKQIQSRSSPKTKSCLIKHVFSAVAKKRKIVVVRYKKPEQRIFDLEEFFERRDENRLDELYDEDVDDPTMKPNRSSSSSKASVIKTSTSSSSTSAAEKVENSFEKPSTAMVEDEEYWRDDPEYLQSLDSLVCFQCQRTFPNVVRMHAHLQMHHESNSKKIQRRMSKDFSVDQDQDRIVQLDGETDLLLDDDGNLMNESLTAAGTSTSGLSGLGTNAGGGGAGVGANTSGGSTSGGPTQLFILKSTGQDDKVYQCPQCPEVFPGQKALLTHQSLVHRNSQTSTIFPCQHCSIGFKDAKSLDLHVRLEHGKNDEKFHFHEEILFS